MRMAAYKIYAWILKYQPKKKKNASVLGRLQAFDLASFYPVDTSPGRFEVFPGYPKWCVFFPPWRDVSYFLMYSALFSKSAWILKLVRQMLVSWFPSLAVRINMLPVVE